MSTTSTPILQQAIGQFKDRNFAKALSLFEQAGQRYGEHLVVANIRLCRQALSASHGTVSVVEPVAKALPLVKANKAATTEPLAGAATTPARSNLDPATQLMLHNSGTRALDESRRQALLAQFKSATQRRSEAAETKTVDPIPADWPKDVVLAPLPESTNDFLWHRRRKGAASPRPVKAGLSVIVPTFNRSRILDVTLACLVNQQTSHDFEVIVADDGSRESIDTVVRKYEDRLDIKYVRQKDYGYQLCAVRNLGMRTARFDYLAILDCDMAPHPGWVQAYVDLLLEDDDVALIGPRKYVDTSAIDGDEFLRDAGMIGRLPEVRTNNTVAGGKNLGDISLDWRLEHFRQTENLRLCDTPFRFFSGGNVAFARKWLEKAGWFDESFTHWGGEDNEFGYRLYRAGCFFRAVDGGLAYHQEPPGKENETDRAEGKKITINIVREKVPYHYRKPEPVESARLHAVPLVSIYIPAYNCAGNIERCVDSALNQTVVDLEVCICDDGSTDDTAALIRQRYGDNPRVRLVSQVNGGIGAASNTAVRMARGHYIGQLDSDDYLEPDAVELCLKEFLADRRLACVYTTNRNVGPDGALISKGYNWPTFSREKFTTAMIVHHFRMFSARAWHLTSGFDATITNAVDYDMYLKLSEVGPFTHVNRVAYNRVLHGENTSIRKLGLQKVNHFAVVNRSLARQKLGDTLRYESVNPSDDACRKYRFDRNA